MVIMTSHRSRDTQHVSAKLNTYPDIPVDSQTQAVTYFGHQQTTLDSRTWHLWNTSSATEGQGDCCSSWTRMIS